jgi:hypothetical protein
MFVNSLKITLGILTGIGLVLGICCIPECTVKSYDHYQAVKAEAIPYHYEEPVYTQSQIMISPDGKTKYEVPAKGVKEAIEHGWRIKS